MTIPIIAIFALIAVTVLYLMVVLARGRMRAAARRQARRDLIRGVVDPARGGVPATHADVEHDASG